VPLAERRGAGKTTLIDAISGFVNSTGTVQLGDRDLRGLPAYERARGGLTRTWQSTELFDDLSVFENLTVAARESGVTEDNAKQTLSLDLRPRGGHRVRQGHRRGHPEEVRRNPKVIAAYLGDGVESTASGPAEETV
jgi:ABC-type branched-subunit amino acid transport system ATPase component